jgi:hypothetical protein
MVLIDAIVYKSSPNVKNGNVLVAAQGLPISSRPKAGDKANTFTGQDKLLNTTAIVTNKTNRKMRRRKIVSLHQFFRWNIEGYNSISAL